MCVKKKSFEELYENDVGNIAQHNHVMGSEDYVHTFCLSIVTTLQLADGGSIPL